MNPDSVAIMRQIDKMSKPMRALVREYGFRIVRDMIAEGCRDPFQLAELLEVWRERRQQQWLETNYVTRKTSQSIADAIQYRIDGSA